MKQTTNYKFNKPELTDLPDITQLNPNFDTIDSELKAHDTEIDTLNEALGNKANSSHSHAIGDLPLASVTEAKAGSIDTKVMTPAKAKESALTFGMAVKSTNPVTSTANDTPAKWKELGAGVYYFSQKDCLINQPKQWGFLVNHVSGSEVFQLWKNQTAGNVYYRSGNSSGWGETWTKCANINETVNLIGDQTIEGTKTFTSNVGVKNNDGTFYIQDPDLTKGTLPDSNSNFHLTFSDGNGVSNSNKIGGVDTVINSTDGTVSTRLVAYDFEKGSSSNAFLGAWYPSSGDPYATAPTTPSGAKGNEVVTANYLKGANSGVVHTTGDENVAGTKTFSAAINGTDLNLSGNIYGRADNARMIIGGATNWNNGGHLAVSGKDYSDNPGGFNLVATDGTTRCELIGKLDGGISYNAKELVRSVNGVSADAAGNVSDVAAVYDSDSKYGIRFTNGLQICWGHVNFAANALSVTVTLPFAFRDKDDHVANITANDGSAGHSVSARHISTSSVEFLMKTTEGGYYDYARTVWYSVVGFWK